MEYLPYRDLSSLLKCNTRNTGQCLGNAPFLLLPLSRRTSPRFPHTLQKSPDDEGSVGMLRAVDSSYLHCEFGWVLEILPMILL